jgi:hypothetical protein
VQLTLTGIAILKKSEQKIYTLARMTSATELVATFVFSDPREVSKPGSKISAFSAAETSADANDEIRETDGQESFDPAKSTPALPDSRSQRVEKPLPGVTPITREAAQPAAAADFKRGLFSCACAPCAPEVRAGPAKSETGLPLILSQSALVSFDGEKAKDLGQRLSQDYLDRVQDPQKGLSVAEAKGELEEVIWKALEDETTDVETVLGLKEALKIFNEKHHDANFSRGRGRSFAQRGEANDVISL